MRFAALSHMLMNGFFFNQGFDIQVSFVRPSGGLRSVFSGESFVLQRPT
jgi:hypothetical protein